MLWKVKIPIDKPWAQFWMSHKTHKEKDNSCNAAKANIPSSSSSELPMQDSSVINQIMNPFDWQFSFVSENEIFLYCERVTGKL